MIPKPTRYRLTSRWIHALRSGSCLIGQDCGCAIGATVPTRSGSTENMEAVAGAICAKVLARDEKGGEKFPPRWRSTGSSWPQSSSPGLSMRGASALASSTGRRRWRCTATGSGVIRRAARRGRVARFGAPRPLKFIELAAGPRGGWGDHGWDAPVSGVCQARMAMSSGRGVRVGESVCLNAFRASRRTRLGESSAARMRTQRSSFDYSVFSPQPVDCLFEVRDRTISWLLICNWRNQQ